jgi:hypothetical protein
MPSYCSLADLKQYLNITDTDATRDTLLQRILDAATARIDSRTQRTYQAAADTVRYFDPSYNMIEGELWLDGDLSHLTSAINGDAENVTAHLYHNPRNTTPWFSLGFVTSSTESWEYVTDTQNAISITGRWAYMIRATVTALARATSVVTAAVYAPDISVGATVYLVDADAGFLGAYTVLSNSGSAITWAQSGSNVTATAAGVLLYCPTDIVQACRRLAAFLYRQKDTQAGDTDRPILAGDGSVIMPTTLPQDVEMLLQPYMRIL